MLEKTLASIGIGSAQLETRLEKQRYRQGDLVLGEITVRGGDVEQEIDAIYMHIVTPDLSGGEGYLFATYQLATSLEIGPDHGTKVIPFEFYLPHDIPVTLDNYPIYIKVGFDSDHAGDLHEEDQIEVLPHLLVEQVLAAMDNIGFQLVAVEYKEGEFFAELPFAQQFEFEATGELAEALNKVGFFFRPDEEGSLEVLMKMEDHAGEEKEGQLTVKADEIEEDLSSLEQLIIERLTTHE